MTLETPETPETPPPTPPKKKPASRRREKLLILLLVLLAIALRVNLRQGGVSGASMEPTYHNNDVVLVWKSYPRDLLKPGDVIIFKDTNGDELIKRIAFIRPWRPLPPAGSYPNPNGGRLIPFAYLFTGDDHFYFDRVAKGLTPPPAANRVIYVLGDNLANSDDSRFIGPISYKQVLGKVVP
ncbi:MAG: signal peptidase bacterial type [Capsulimonas sp.]|jgi:signal peptidase I|nr:signal peptidase bacterial type [Capsulimonas sp.]